MHPRSSLVKKKPKAAEIAAAAAAAAAAADANLKGQQALPPPRSGC
jgi:hypothetical protein